MAEQLEVRLARIEQKLDDFFESYAKVSNGVGYPRCAERKEQLTNLTDNYTWLRNIMFSAFVSIMLAFGGKLFYDSKYVDQKIKAEVQQITQIQKRVITK